MIKKAVIKKPLVIDPDKCKSCKACMKIGCPAISVNKETKKAGIDDTLCVGCELCTKMCKFGAIEIKD